MASRDTVNQIYQSVLGRLPSDTEGNGFAGLIDQKQISAMDLMTHLQGSAEYQNNMFSQRLQQYQGAVQGGANSFVGNILGRGYDMAQSQMYQQGRPQSSGLGAMYAQTAGNIAGNLGGQYMQGLQGYAGNYLGGMQQQQYGYGQSAYDPQTLRSRQWQEQDFNRMADFYEKQYQRQRSGGLWGTVGGFAGGLIGNRFGPIGAYYGSQIGRGVGQYMGS